MGKKKATSRQNNIITATLGGLLGIVLAYAILSRAFNTGSFIQYSISVLFFVLGMKLLIHAYKIYHGNN